jgi:hypothetical protein
MNLDKVVTIAIGRNISDGTPMTNNNWLDMQIQLIELVTRYAEIVFRGEGSAVGSDGRNDGQYERSFVVIAINPKGGPNGLRLGVADLLVEFDQRSAAYSVDESHEPVWSTHNGKRPPVATSAAYAPTHGGYPDLPMSAFV